MMRGKKGLTLVETVLAVLILAFVMSAGLGAFLIGRFVITDAKHRVKAMNLVRERMEWVMTQGATTIEGWIASPLDLENDVDDAVGTDELLNDTRTTTVAYKNVNGNNMLEITVTLNWDIRRLGGTTVKGTAGNPDAVLSTLKSL